MSRGRAAADGKRSAVELLIIETLEPTPEDATHWSTRSMAAEVGLSERGVADLAGIRAAPHRQETRELSCDPQFLGKVRDVVGLYLDPPERAADLRVDEKVPDPGA
jgi:hypothetical protein